MNNKILIQDIYDVVNRLEDKLDRRLEKLETRMDSVEGFKNKVMGLSVILSVFAGTVSTWVWKKLTGE